MERLLAWPGRGGCVCRGMVARSHLNLTITILLSFTLVFAVALAVAVLGYRKAGDEAAIATADLRLAQAAHTAAARADGLIGPVLLLTGALARTAAWSGVPGHPGTALLAALDAEPELLSASVAGNDGSLRQALRVAAMPPAVLPPHPREAAWALREGVFDRPGTAWRFFAVDGRELAPAATAAPPDDPRASQWFLQAREPGVHLSTLYDLPLARRPGLSVSAPLADGSGVLGFDLTLDALGAFLRAQTISPHGTVFLFNDIGIVMAHQDPTLAFLHERDGDGEHTVWITAGSSPDPLLRAVWDAYADRSLLPGSGGVIDIGGVPTMVRLEAVGGRIRPAILAAVAAPREDFTRPVLDAVQRATARALLAFAAGLICIAWVSWRIARPLGVLTREAEAIRKFELARPLVLRSRITEVERLAAAMSAMKSALATFGAYVPRDLVRRLLQAGEVPRLGGERLPLSIMFTDVKGFTSIAEPLDPAELMLIVSAYFEALTAELLSAGATIDKFIGDAIMAMWNAPSRDPAHAASACHAALRARAVSHDLAARFVARGWPALPTRFGVHTGEAVVGNVGSSDRLSYTAMGSMVNLANRLEALNRVYGTEILVSDQTRRAAGPAFAFRTVDLVVPKGASEPIEIHELLGLAPGRVPRSLVAGAAVLERLPAWEICVAAYRAGRFGDAARALRDTEGAAPDALCTLYAGRLAAFADAAAPRGWSPEVRYAEK